MVSDVLIVGAGISGLVAANAIQNAGYSVTVVDKGRSTGGRLATRRIQNGKADHGAQFFTVRSDLFQQQVDTWLDKNLVGIWGHGWSDGSAMETKPDGHPRYMTYGGMNQLAQDLAKPLTDVHLNCKISEIAYSDNLWQLTNDSGEVFEATILLMTPPVPQSRALLQSIVLSDTDWRTLERITYGACLCGLFVVDGDVQLPEPGALQNFDKTIYWIADNTAKGISPNERIITLHASPEWSAKNYDAPESENLAFFREELEKHMLDNATIKEAQLKKWRYSIPQTMHDEDIYVSATVPVLFAGDAFGGRARVEGAYLSGYAAGQHIINMLSQN